MLAMLTAALGTLLTGCANNSTFATLSGAAASFPRAECQVRGKTKNDQAWIDKTIEAEVAGFGFDRPEKCAAAGAVQASRAIAPRRPVSAPKIIQPAAPHVPAAATAPPVTQKKTLRQRLDELNAKVRRLEGRTQ